jgi:hypothetical protein
MKKIIYLIAIFTTVGLFSNCNSGHCPSDLYFEPNEIISEYHQNYLKNFSDSTFNENFAVYLDYSSGIKIAFDDEKTLNFYELFINSLKISKVDFYQVDKSDITEIKNLDKTELYKKVKETDKFTGINAPIDKAVTQIVELGIEAVLITDGELWDNGERDDPWAREQFEDWLVAGNAIDFFVTDHLDANKGKHLFYMFFIPENKINDQNNISNLFLFYLNNSVESKDLIYTQFSFSTNTYKLVQEYATEVSGGINENVAHDEYSYVNQGETLGFEYMDFMMKWKDMMEYIQYSYDSNGNQIERGDPVLNKLYIETSGLEFYTVEELGLKIYDIRTDFEKFKIMKEAVSNPPTFILDETGEVMLDAENHKIVDCPGQYEAYDMFGNLILDTSFIASSGLPEVNEVFDFDNEVFMNSFKEEGRGEVVIKFHENFNGSQISSETENLFRIDVYLKTVTPNTSNPNLEKFIWDGKQVDKNRSIYNSILGALNAANPQGEIIYTYYVRALPYKK